MTTETTETCAMCEKQFPAGTLGELGPKEQPHLIELWCHPCYLEYEDPEHPCFVCGEMYRGSELGRNNAQNLVCNKCYGDQI